MTKIFDWYGGKLRMVPAILACLPPDIEIWHEACMGSAAVTLNSVPHTVDMISDLDDDLVYLFGMLADSQEGPDLLERLLELQYSKSEFLCARTAKKTNYSGLDKYRHAELIYILITQSFNNARQSYRNSGVSQRDYEFMLQANLPDVCRRLQNVVVCKMNCIDAVDKLRDNEKAFVLLDVPYRWEMRAEGSCRIYGHEMNNDEHRKLLSVCKDAQCKIMLFGYRSEDGSDLYDQMLGIPGSHWNHYTLARVVKSCQTKATKDIATETIWVNYPLPYSARYFINIKDGIPALRQWTSTPQSGTLAIPENGGIVA